MALSIAETSPRSYDVWGHFKVRLVTVTFDNDLDEAGEAFAAADVGLSQIFAVVPAGPAVSTTAETTFPTVWKADVLYGIISASDYVGDNFDASTYSVVLLVIGI